MESEHPHLAPTFGVDALSVSPFCMMLAMGLLYIMLRFPLSQPFHDFYHEELLDFVQGPFLNLLR